MDPHTTPDYVWLSTTLQEETSNLSYSFPYLLLNGATDYCLKCWRIKSIKNFDLGLCVKCPLTLSPYTGQRWALCVKVGTVVTRSSPETRICRPPVSTCATLYLASTLNHAGSAAWHHTLYSRATERATLGPSIQLFVIRIQMLYLDLNEHRRQFSVFVFDWGVAVSLSLRVVESSLSVRREQRIRLEQISLDSWIHEAFDKSSIDSASELIAIYCMYQKAVRKPRDSPLQ